MRRVLLGLVCLAATAGCGNRTVAPAMTPDGGGGAPDAASSDQASATDAASAPDAVGSDTHAGRVPYRALAIAAGRYHTCALLDDHEVKCWGTGYYGQLGLGDDQPRGVTPAEMGDALPAIDLGTGRTATAIAAARYATCAILDDASVKCWGFGGQTAVPAATPTDQRLRGNAPGEMGDALPPVDLGAGRRAKRIVMGIYTTCAQLEDDALRCWGDAESLADVPEAPRGIVDLQGADGVMALLEDGTVARVYTEAADPTSPMPSVGHVQRSFYGPFRGVRAVAMGGTLGVACIVIEGGGVTCTSTSFDNAAITDVRALAVAEQGPVCALRATGRVTCWGGSAGGDAQSVIASPREADGSFDIRLREPAVAVAAGQYQACALQADGTVWCWPLVDPSRSFAGAATGGTWPAPDGWHAVDLGTRPAP